MVSLSLAHAPAFGVPEKQAEHLSRASVSSTVASQALQVVLVHTLHSPVLAAVLVLPHPFGQVIPLIVSASLHYGVPPLMAYFLALQVQSGAALTSVAASQAEHAPLVQVLHYKL